MLRELAAADSPILRILRASATALLIAGMAWVMTRWYSTRAKRNVEDLYQEKLAEQRGGKAIISVVATFPTDAAFDDAASSMEGKLTALKSRYMVTHAPRPFDFVISNFPAMPEVGDTWDVSVVLHAPKRTMCLELNHATIGGGCLVELGKHLANGQGMPELPESSLRMGLLCLPSLIVLKTRPTVPTLDIDQAIRRHWWGFDYTKQPGESMRAALLFKVLDTVRRATGKQVLRTYLPIAFVDNIPGARNNIGIIFIDFEASDSVSSLHQKIQKYRYQAHATNLLVVNGLVGKGSGSTTRKGVDCVVTQVYLEHASNESFLWSYYNKPEYPMYIAVASNKRKDGTMRTNVTVTSVTSGFKPTSEMKDLGPPVNNGRLFMS
mmetsp:Transcript_7284/g.13603  ORF Transcript_7284/g.13603 Transcript_7284/m.13603 type:complete len:380 (+) Transcript_7284:49-1188(+)